MIKVTPRGFGSLLRLVLLALLVTQHLATADDDVVAGIYETADEANAQSDKFKKWAPTAYSKKTKIYMGCLH